MGAGRWKLTNLPVIPETFKLNISPKTASQFTVINNLIKKNSYEFEISNIVLSDAHARQLLSPEKKTEIIRGFYDEDKKTHFDARCTLDAGNPGKILISEL